MLLDISAPRLPTEIFRFEFWPLTADARGLVALLETTELVPLKPKPFMGTLLIWGVPPPGKPMMGMALLDELEFIPVSPAISTPLIEPELPLPLVLLGICY